MNNANNQREVEALIEAYLDGSLTEPESARLLNFLRQKPSLATVILQSLRTDCLIRSVVAESTMAATSATPENVIPMPMTEQESHEPARRIMPSARWRVPLALAACVALLLGLSIWYFGPTMGEPVLTEVSAGSVTLERAGQTIAAAVGVHLQSGDVLNTATNATATVTFGREKTRLELRADTELKLTSFSDAKHFALRSGKLVASVARQRPFKPMLVRTPQAEARVLGTEFEITTTTNVTRLEVAEGKVRLTRASDGTRVDVPADHYAIAAARTELCALPKTGSILREYWTNLPDSAINDLLDHPDYPDRPSGRDYVDLLEVPAVGATNYGCRLVGYLHPPVTGQYIFWIAASPAAAVNLSLDENPANAVRIFGPDFDFGRGRESKPREWGRKAGIPRTQSQPITLVAGRRYYIEAIHKADDRVGHLAIAWTPPGGERDIIAGKYLSPFKPKK